MAFTTKIEPYPYTANILAGIKVENGPTVAFLIAIAFAIIPAVVAGQIVNERLKTKHQQIISGVNLLSYWLSNYFLDWIRSIIVIIIAVIFILSVGIDLPYSWVLFLLFSLSIHPFTYATSFMFKNENSARNYTASFHIFFGGFIANAILLLHKSGKFSKIGKLLRWFFMIIPSFSLISGMLAISNRIIISREENLGINKIPLSFEIAGGDAIFLFIDIFFWWFIVYIIENDPISFILRKWYDTNGVRKVQQFGINSDVINEEIRCDDLKPKEASVLVKRLTKVYSGLFQKSVVAVRDTSFALEQGECFALLGVNGGGKTTTFKVMTGDLAPSNGEVYIQGLDLSNRKQYSKARKCIGYCPQENAFFEYMTVLEHLWFYARIKGILKHLREPIIQNLLKEMDLKQYENIQVQKLSGGNKRKVSVAIAILGNPPIVFLDEPSTGLDPKSKLFMWNMISKISCLSKKTTIILTTHSMEEAEAVSTRMGIMVKGSLKCIGSTQHIKHKYGHGYEVGVRIPWPSEEEAKQLAYEKDVDASITVTQDNVQDILQKAQMESLIEPYKYKTSNVYAENDKNISVVSLYQWAIMERAGFSIKEELEQNNVKCSFLEHYNNFFRYKVDLGSETLSFLFKIMENLKDKIQFEEYTINQTSLEQIFNKFASEQDEVRLQNSPVDNVFELEG